MWPVMIFLVLMVAFYWGAFYISVVAWLNALGHLFRGNFIRASIWACLGFGMLCWWQGTDVIPDPWDFDKWLKGSAWVVGLGALATFVRWRKKQQAMQTMPTMPVWTPPAATPGNIAPVIEVEYKRLPN
jgi:hypothetical protein